MCIINNTARKSLVRYSTNAPVHKPPGNKILLCHTIQKCRRYRNVLLTQTITYKNKETNEEFAWKRMTSLYNRPKAWAKKVSLLITPRAQRS